MKTIAHIIALILLFLNLGLAQSRGNKYDIVQNLPLKDFKGINSHIAADIYLTQADTFSFQIEAKSKVIKLLETEIVGGILKIQLDKSSDIWDSWDKAIIHISAPSFERLEFSGAGKVYAEKALTGKTLSVRVSGASSLNFKSIDIDSLSLELSGVGNINMTGKAQSAYIELSGTGNIDVMDLKIQNATCQLSGLGALSCDVENHLNAYVSGMGKIRYKTEPKSLNKSISGIGKVRQQ